MKILGVETSCDETAAALCEARGGSFKVSSNIVSSQIKIHRRYGGVVPEVAARKHSEIIYEVIKQALGKNKTDSIDLIAVTEGPGLVTSLRVGVLAAQSLAMLANIPLVGVNHVEAHLLSPFFSCHCEQLKGARQPRDCFAAGAPRKNIQFPALGLIVSGGHTELVLVKDFGKYKIVGSTRDDAVGEAFDKVAKMLNLGYPGGPAISREAAKSCKPKAVSRKLKLPRPMLDSGDFDFSFAGLKTAVLYLTKKMAPAELKKNTPAIAAEFQKAAVEVLVHKTKKAAEKYGVKNILAGGGVVANKELREALMKLDFPVYLPEMQFTGDNAAMIAFAGYKKWQRTKKNDVLKIKAEANLRI